MIGTGVKGRWTTNRANPAVIRLKKRIRAISRAILVPDPFTGKAKSMRERVGV